MNTRQCPIPAVADATTLIVAMLYLFVAGCGSEEALDGRVAIDVTIQVGGESPESGTLVLKPERGVRSPLIRIPISDGTGSLPSTKGPVPGSYRASFRSGAAGGDIDEQLTKTGREMPSSRDRESAANSRQRNRKAPKAKSEVSVTVPDENPATLTVTFDAA
jgi:hypothetical protein